MESLLISIIGSIISGTSIESVIAGLTTEQELMLGAGALELLAPKIASAFGLPKLAPETLILAVAKGLSDEFASQAMRDFLSNNAAEAERLQPGISSQS